MSKFAIIETGGKQYRVTPGQKVRVEKLEAKEGDSVSFDKVLLSSLEGNVKIGTPYISGAKVEATVRTQGRGEKKITFKYRPKARHHRTKGHRQPFTEIEITAI